MAAKRRVLVAGGGVSGLVAARALAASYEVVLAEESADLGGKIRTTSFRDRPLDLGPDVFITRNPSAERLVREIGLSGELIAPAVAVAGVYVDGAIRPLPGGLALGIPTDLLALFRSRVVSPTGTARALFGWFPGGRLPDDLGRASGGGADLSIERVVTRRYGRQVSERLVAPLLGGINAGSVSELSFEATAPELARAAAGRRRLAAALRAFATRPGRVTSSPTFLGLRPGLAALTGQLEKECLSAGVRVERGVAVRAIAREGDHWEARLAGQVEPFDGVLLALPAFAAARLLARPAARLAEELAAIPYAGVATVTMAWDRTALPEKTLSRIDSLSGVLIPPGAMLSTALTFVSTKWPRSAHEGEVVVRASVGRHGDERALALDDDALASACGGEAALVLATKAAPLETRIERFPQALPQFIVGHLSRLARIATLEAQLSGLALAGAWGTGLGIPASVESASRAVDRLGAALAR